jgi:hypothetical protein
MNSIFSKQYNTHDELIKELRDEALNVGFDIVIGRSGKSKSGDGQYCHLHCKHGGKYKPHRNTHEFENSTENGGHG